MWQPAQVPPITEDAIRKQAMAWAQQAGWTVLFADCQVRIAPSEDLTRTDPPDAWLVHMLAQPLYNSTLERPMPLACRVQLIEGELCGISLDEPSDRTPYLC